MNKENDLKRFLDAQKKDYAIALSEIKAGRKRSHWMWYIFPQIHGLGFSRTSNFYAIKNKEEAMVFMQHPLLGSWLIAICKQLLQLENDNANAIFGSPDDMKLKSCMTLFASLPDADPVFEDVLRKFFNGEKDDATLRIIRSL